MDQGVIRNLKLLYHKRLLDHLLLSDSDAVQSIPDFYKMISLKDCCYLAAESWETVKQSTLRNTWNEILIGRRTVATSVDNDEGNDITGIIHTLKSLSLCGECAEPDVHRWLTCDSNEQGLQLMSDEGIIEFMSKQPAGNEEEQHADEDEGEHSAVPTHNEAFVQLEAALLWFEDQEECDERRLLCLKSIRDLAASKRKSVLKQTLITDYLK
ncbi:hypothetical protein M514_02348 [Trichuris suis]|uniref:DDE-1 domain-containing protein n=1 Tax=Trichuris suis TaxID=68888 RepID=A0A085MHH6_9BILA|nr:hypothetical protein M513_02348 [Trichuris suis]KFD66861.1 hypothetical protein M514_02348 [Trichuris suis]